MKAAFIKSYGRHSGFITGNLPDPVSRPGYVLISVKAVSVNPVDYKVKSGIAFFLSGFRFPKVLGTDFAGVVSGTGPGVTDFAPGDRVYGSTSVIFGNQGALAETVAVKSVNVRKMPDTLTFEEAASLPVAALTALTGMRKCNVAEGTSILINGATGGVGHFAVQLAKARGAIVTATCSENNSELAKSLGADFVTGYSSVSLASIGKPFDAIFDAWGKMKYDDVCRLLRKGGTYASPLFFFPSQIPALLVKIVFGKKLTSANMRGLPEDYATIEKLYETNKLKPVIEKIYTLDTTNEAFEFAENGRPRGKVIIRI